MVSYKKTKVKLKNEILQLLMYYKFFPCNNSEMHTLDTHKNPSCFCLQSYILFFVCIPIVQEDKSRYHGDTIKINSCEK